MIFYTFVYITTRNLRTKAQSCYIAHPLTWYKERCSYLNIINLGIQQKGAKNLDSVSDIQKNVRNLWRKTLIVWIALQLMFLFLFNNPLWVDGGELYEPREYTQSELNPFRCTFYATQCCQLIYGTSFQSVQRKIRPLRKATKFSQFFSPCRVTFSISGLQARGAWRHAAQGSLHRGAPC